jgi:hypothetical protein
VIAATGRTRERKKARKKERKRERKKEQRDEPAITGSLKPTSAAYLGLRIMASNTEERSSTEKSSGISRAHTMQFRSSRTPALRLLSPMHTTLLSPWEKADEESAVVGSKTS